MSFDFFFFAQLIYTAFTIQFVLTVYSLVTIVISELFPFFGMILKNGRNKIIDTLFLTEAVYSYWDPLYE